MAGNIILNKNNDIKHKLIAATFGGEFIFIYLYRQRTSFEKWICDLAIMKKRKGNKKPLKLNVTR